MEIRKIKFPKKLFRKKVMILSDSEDDYAFFTNLIDFDPIYFLNESRYGRSLSEIFSLINLNAMSVGYIDDCNNISFDIEFIPISNLTYNLFKNTMISFYGGCCKFLYETCNNYYMILVYKDL